MAFSLLNAIKTLNKWISNFFLDAFYVHKNAVFFIFVRLYAFLCFMLVKFSRKKKKKKKRLKITLMTSITILLRNWISKTSASYKLCLYCQHTWWGSHQCCYYLQHFHRICFYTFMLKHIFKTNPFLTNIFFNPSQVSTFVRYQ